MTRHVDLSLLPTNATKLETALSLVSAEHRDLIPWGDLAKVFDPALCPERLLPWLATVFSVDVWFESWSVERKREVIARSVELHRAKGTIYGLEEYVELVDGRVASVVTPPALFFASDFGADAYADWYNRLPEVRIFHWAEDTTDEISGATGEAPDPTLAEDEEVPDCVVEQFLALSDVDFTDETTVAAFCLESEDYPVRSGVRAILIENGVETELGIEAENESDARGAVVSDVERVFFPEDAGLGLFLSTVDPDDPIGEDLEAYPTFLDFDSYLHDGSDKRYVIYVRRSGQRVTEIGAASIRGRAAADSDPIRVYVDGDVLDGWFLDDPYAEPYCSVPNDIVYSYYDSWRVVDPAVQATFGPDFSFLDFDRFGIPPYTAEAQIDLTERGAWDQWFLDDGPPTYFAENDFVALNNLCDVVVVAKAKRDEVLLDLDYASRPSIRRLYSLSALILR
jgi:phage tail P2-like protein